MPRRNVTPRQRQVWELIANGDPNKIIAFKLGLEEATIKVHIRNLMAITKTTNRVQLAVAYGREPVGWFVKDFADGWIFFDTKADAEREVKATGAMMLAGIKQ